MPDVTTTTADLERGHLAAALDAALAASSALTADRIDAVTAALQQAAAHLLAAATSASDRDRERAIRAVRDEVGACLLAADAADDAATAAAALRLRTRAVEAIVTLAWRHRRAS